MIFINQIKYIVRFVYMLIKLIIMDNLVHCITCNCLFKKSLVPIWKKEGFCSLKCNSKRPSKECVGCGKVTQLWCENLYCYFDCVKINE